MPDARLETLMPTNSQQLEQVRALLKSGKRSEAAKRLTTLIENDHDNPELWWLMANSLDEPQSVRRALDEMVAVAPNPKVYQERARKLNARLLVNQISDNNQRKGGSTLAWVLGILLIIAIVVGGALFLSDFENRRRADEAAQTALPTIIVLPTETATSTPSNTPTPTNTATLTPTNTATPTATQTSTPTETLAPTATLTASATLTATNLLPGLGLTVQAMTQASSGLPTATQGFSTATPTIDPEATVDPESTAVLGLPLLSATPNTIATTSGNTAELPEGFNQVSAAALVGRVRVNQDILIDDTARRAVIKPHEDHAWTFSGYRDQAILIHARALGRESSAALELYDADDILITQAGSAARGVTSSIGTDLSVTLPADGVYTVVVRFNAVDQQLYTLKLERP